MGYCLLAVVLVLGNLSAAHAANPDFPFNGGTTSDGIEISKAKMLGMKVNGNNSLQLEQNKSQAKITFSMTVPKGKTACLQYKVFLSLIEARNSSNVVFMLLDGKKKLKEHKENTSVDYNKESVLIGQGKHEITLSASFKPTNCKVAGYIDSLSVHIHDFPPSKITDEPRCGEKGTTESHCTVCGQLQLTEYASKFSKHVLVEKSGRKPSCMSNVASDSVCVNCSYTKTSHSGSMKPHDFDDDGRCKVCQLCRPKSRGGDSIFDIRSASEMRVLAELVSIGDISGNIGVNILSDLVFDEDTTMLPLGTFDHPFQGVLNGNGHRIRGIAHLYQGMDALGFVGVAKGTLLSHAVISNLIFDEGNDLRGEACVGGIVGYAANCDIINCASFGTLEGNDNVGGIVGYADQQVSIINCAAVAHISTLGTWSTVACGMPSGHILNSYGVAANDRDGTFDELPTATLRHCFSSQGSADGLTLVSDKQLTSYSMVQLLNEESESPRFMLAQNGGYPVPVIDSTIQAATNPAIPTRRSSEWRHAPETDIADAGEPTEKDNLEVVEISGYQNESAASRFSKTIEEIMSSDSVRYAHLNRLYIVTRSAPEGAHLYEPVSGGEMTSFESYLIPEDSSFVKMTEYELVSPDRVRPVSETLYDRSSETERIDEYIINNGTSHLQSRITFESDDDIVCQELIDGMMRPVWNIETEYDTEGNPTVTNAYSYNYKTGEFHLELSYSYDSEEERLAEESYTEYVDNFTNTIHVMYSYRGLEDTTAIYRDHYLLRASDEYPLEVLTERMNGDEAILEDGMYFIYDDEGSLVQSVAFGPKDADDPDSELSPYLYFEYTGYWQNNSLPTAIRVPAAEQPSAQKLRDPNVYDMHGRVVRRAADVKDPFSGLPRGLYIYQGAKYLKRN